MTSAVVLIVLAFVSHLEFSSFFIRLLGVDFTADLKHIREIDLKLCSTSLEHQRK